MCSLLSGLRPCISDNSWPKTNTPIKHKHKTWVDLLRPPLRRLRTYLVRLPFSSTKLFFLPPHSKSPRSTWQFFCHLPCKTNFLRKAFWTKGYDQQGYPPDHWLKPSPGSLVSLGIGLPRVGPIRLCLSSHPHVRRKLRKILIISLTLQRQISRTLPKRQPKIQMN